jgi:hypothetical protein
MKVVALCPELAPTIVARSPYARCQLSISPAPTAGNDKMGQWVRRLLRGMRPLYPLPGGTAFVLNKRVYIIMLSIDTSVNLL